MIAVLLGCGLLVNACGLGPAQPIDAHELATYRLTAPVLGRFAHASRLIGGIMRTDRELAHAPLFTREILVSGDAVEMAAMLERRLLAHPRLAAALDTAGIAAREYTTFALALVAARLAHGFVESGALRYVPAGIATDNLHFVDAHHAEVLAVLRELGLEETPSPSTDPRDP